MNRAENADWLEQVVEPAVDPARPICDPHHHLWDKRKRRIETNRRYLQDELLDDIVSSGHNVVSTVYSEAESMYRHGVPEEMAVVGEVEFANGVAAMFASGLYGELRACAGIIGYADMRLGTGVEPVLEALVAAAPERFKGVRYTGAWDSNPEIARATARGLYLDPEVRTAVSIVGRMGLVFDMVCRFHQLDECKSLAMANPGVPLVLNHLGSIAGVGQYEGKQDEVYEQWRQGMRRLAECDNVTVKLGGIGNDYCGFGWHQRPVPPTSDELVTATRRYYLTTIELFGPERCMFESNFPADKISCSYGVLWNSFKKIVADFSDAEKDDLFHGVATRVYSLPGSIG